MMEDISCWCVPLSILNAWCVMAKNKVPVRIAVFKIDEGVDHVQAQYYQDEDGTWQYLTEFWTGQGMVIRDYGKNLPDAPEPYRYVGLLAFINEQIEVLELTKCCGG